MLICFWRYAIKNKAGFRPALFFFKKGVIVQLIFLSFLLLPNPYTLFVVQE